MDSTSSKWTVISWGLYDFASSIFSMNIITLYFVLWVTVDMHGEDFFYSVALSGSMLLTAIIAPIVGTVSDRIGKKMPFLIILTIGAFTFTFGIGLVHGLLWALLAFVLANFCYQLADVFFNALLPQISSPRNTGRISGLGKGMGYLGVIIGLLVVGPIAIHYGRHTAFIPTALLFILFALPSFFLIKDPPRSFQLNKKRTANVVVAAFLEVKHTLVNIRRYSDLARSLLAIFLAFNTVSTVFIFMSVYVSKVVGFTAAEIQIFYIICAIVAGIGSLVAGVITDFWGAKRTLALVLILWCGAIVFAGVASQKWIFWIIGSLVGACLGGVWTSSRALVAELSPANMSGEVFGFYGLVGKTSAVIAPLVWGVCIWGFTFLGMMKYRITVIFLLIFLIAGIIILRKVPNRVKTHG